MLITGSEARAGDSAGPSSLMGLCCQQSQSVGFHSAHGGGCGGSRLIAPADLRLGGCQKSHLTSQFVASDPMEFSLKTGGQVESKCDGGVFSDGRELQRILGPAVGPGAARANSLPEPWMTLSHQDGLTSCRR